MLFTSRHVWYYKWHSVAFNLLSAVLTDVVEVEALFSSVSRYDFVVVTGFMTFFFRSDTFLTHESTSQELRNHVRQLISTNATRFVCVRMNDVLSEQIAEYFKNELRFSKLTVLENEEFMLWAKLAYFFFTNQPNEVKVRKKIIKIQ